jgi:5-carboxymethyl-2-hydroxymuconate isomerase
VPHFQIDYSANLEAVVDIGQLCEAIRARAATIETFPMAGIRVRATRVDHVAMANGDVKHGFIDLSVRLREGRPDAVKRDAIDQIFATLKDFMTPAMASHSIALSAEMRDINAKLSLKFGTVRDHLEDKA